MPRTKDTPKRKFVRKEMEYEQAPSGYVTLYNYKEPFMSFKDGYGYQGVLLFDGASDKVQCHFCGEWYETLGHHLQREHNMRAHEYKKEVGLNHKTALIGEKFRAKLIASGNEARRKNLRDNTGRTVSKETRAKISKSVLERRLEKRNLTGTCPEQLIDRLLKLYAELGDQMSSKKVPFIEAVVRTYGSYINACKIAGIPYRTPADGLKIGWETNTKKTEVRIEVGKQFVYRYYKEHGALPAFKDFRSSGFKSEYQTLQRKGLLKSVYKESVMRVGAFNKSVAGTRFTKDELLSILKNFEKQYDRKPSYSDARRRLIPHLSRYSYHFGSWQNALSLAFKQ